MVYLRNSWYVVGRSNEVVDKPVARRVLDEPLVLYRCGDKSVGVLEDHCPHRHVPLSIGSVQGNYLRCGYHGMTFDKAGKCVGVPSQPVVPPNTRVKSYPTQEKFGWIWAWMGNAADADPAKIPSFAQLTDPRFAAVGDMIHVAASYQLVVDNLLDLSHVGYVHRTTIGGDGMGEKGKLSVEPTAAGVRVRRVVPEVSVPPAYLKLGFPPDKKMDRYQIIEFVAPCFVIIQAGGAEAGTGALEGKTEQGFNFWILNAATPETANTTHYFWSVARSHALNDTATDKLLYNQTAEAFSEDKTVLEAQQRVINSCSDTWSVALRQDAGSIQARSMREKLIAAEATGTLAAHHSDRT
jgi:vanillate O-demethylase monooxygenase subunit